MNKEIVEGKFDQVAGAIKQKTGEALDDQSLANAGVAEQVKGAAKESWGNAKDVAEHRRTSAEADRTDHADNARDRIVDAAQNVKNNINAKLDEMRDRRDA